MLNAKIIEDGLIYHFIFTSCNEVQYIMGTVAKINLGTIYYFHDT